MTVIDDQGRPEPPLVADEATMLFAFLDYQRATLEWKTSGLDAAGLSARLSPSTMTLGGLLKHLAWVEDYWFSRRLFDRPAADSWANVDWKANPDWEWESAVDDTPEQLRRLWSDAVARSRKLVEQAMTGEGLDRLATRKGSDTREPSLRWILVHMIEEYARHNGHADLLRESVDGETGE